MGCYRSGTVKLGRMVNTDRVLAMDDALRQLHLYLVGATRTGKTKQVESIIRHDIIDRAVNPHGAGLLLLDPHGSLYNDLAQWLTDNPWIKAPVLFLDPRRDDFVVPYNLLRRRTAGGKDADETVVVGNLLNAMSYVWGADGTQSTPQFNKIARRLLLTLYHKGLTVKEAHLFLSQANRQLRQHLTDGISDRNLQMHWAELDALSIMTFMDAVSSTVNRFEAFLEQKRLTRMFGIVERSLDLMRALEEGYIILVNLSTEGAQISRESTRVLGTVLLADLWVTAQQRGKASDRTTIRPFHIYIDEVQNFITPTLAEDLDQASGFGLRLILAHQFPSQLSGASEHGKRLLRSLMTNARNKIVFGGIGSPEDLEPLVDYLYMGALDPDEVKHMLSTTKVLEYREEMRRAYGRAEGSSWGGGWNTGTSQGWGTSSPFDSFNIGTMSQSSGNSRGQNSSWAESRVNSVIEAPMLIPVLGREITSIQFRSLDEQRRRAMAAMFDQEQRHFLARLAGMKEPVFAVTPFLEPGIASRRRVEAYIAATYETRWRSLALPVTEADRLLEARAEHFDRLLLKEPQRAEAEPVSYRRRVQ